jgi:hypothetical protein
LTRAATARAPAAHSHFLEKQSMKEVDKKHAPAISGGYLGPDAVIPVRIPDNEFPTAPITGTGEDDLPIGSEPK